MKEHHLKNNLESVKGAWRRKVNSAPVLGAPWLRLAAQNAVLREVETEETAYQFLIGAALSAAASLLVFVFSSAHYQKQYYSEIGLVSLLSLSAESSFTGGQE